MKRRRLLRVGSALGLLAIAGCTGSTEPAFKLRVSNQDIDRDDNGMLVLHVTVSNPGNTPQNGTLYVTSKLNGEDIVRVREVSLDAHETDRITIEYDVAMKDVDNFSPRTDIKPRA